MGVDDIELTMLYAMAYNSKVLSFFTLDSCINHVLSPRLTINIVCTSAALCSVVFVSYDHESFVLLAGWLNIMQP
jgi:hypothetical protein